MKLKDNKQLNTLLKGPKEKYEKMLENKKYPEYPIRGMMETLCSFSDETWMNYAFNKDLLRDKIDADIRAEIGPEAERCGLSYAEKLRAEYGEVSLDWMCEQLGVKVERPFRASQAMGGNQILFAQFTAPADIQISNELVDLCRKCIAENRLGEILGKDFDPDRTLLAHEMFHFFEERDRKSIYTETYRLQLNRKGLIKNRTRVSCLGEIAAMAFSKEMNGLDFSPFALDVLFLYVYDSNAACGMYESILKKTGNRNKLSGESPKANSKFLN